MSFFGALRARNHRSLNSETGPDRPSAGQARLIPASSPDVSFNHGAGLVHFLFFFVCVCVIVFLVPCRCTLRCLSYMPTFTHACIDICVVFVHLIRYMSACEVLAFFLLLPQGYKEARVLKRALEPWLEGCAESERAGSSAPVR